jgi:hypothetical protein
MGGTPNLKVVDLLTPSQKSYFLRLQRKMITATNRQEVKKYAEELHRIIEEVKCNHFLSATVQQSKQETLFAGVS